MKKTLLIAFLALIALIVCVSAADAVTVTSTYSETAPTFGSSSAQASNPDSDNEADENIYVNGDITLNNSGTSAVTITGITVTAESKYSNTNANSDGYINITLNDADLTIDAGTSEAVTLRARIPEILDAVDNAGNQKAFKVAAVTFTFSDASTASFNAYMQRENKLSISKFYITSEEHDRKSYTNSDSIDKLKPGEDVEVEIKAENTYTSDDNLEIGGITAYLEIDDGDMDVEEESDISDLKADKDDITTLKFSIDSDIDEEDYDGIVYVLGEDDHGAQHGNKWTLTFTVERKSHEVLFKTAAVTPSPISCDRSATLTAKFENAGKNDEDEIALYVRNTALGINFEKEDIEVESADTYTKTFTASVSSTVAAGTYPVRFTVYYSGDEDDGVQGDLKDVDLVVQSCATTTPVTEEEEEEEEEETTVIPLAPEETEVITPPTTTTEEEDGITETIEKPFTESWMYPAILIAAIAIAAAWLVFSMVKFAVERREK